MKSFKTLACVAIAAFALVMANSSYACEVGNEVEQNGQTVKATPSHPAVKAAISLIDEFIIAIENVKTEKELETVAIGFAEKMTALEKQYPDFEPNESDTKLMEDAMLRLQNVAMKEVERIKGNK